MSESSGIKEIGRYSTYRSFSVYIEIFKKYSSVICTDACILLLDVYKKGGRRKKSE